MILAALIILALLAAAVIGLVVLGSYSDEYWSAHEGRPNAAQKKYAREWMRRK